MPPHFDTPRKAEIQGAKKYIEFLERERGEPIEKRKLATLAVCFKTSEKQISTTCASKRARRTLGDDETRGGYRGDEVLRFGEEQVRDATRVIEQNGHEGHNLDYGSLRHEAQLPDVCDKTIQRNLRKSERIGRFIAFTKEELELELAEHRVERVRELLKERPKKEDWRNVLFS